MYLLFMHKKVYINTHNSSAIEIYTWDFTFRPSIYEAHVLLTIDYSNVFSFFCLTAFSQESIINILKIPWYALSMKSIHYCHTPQNTQHHICEASFKCFLSMDNYIH